MIIENTTDLGMGALISKGASSGFIGISLPHPFFSVKNMSEYFKWASPRFNRFLVILMDDPDKYNFMVFKNMEDNLALAKVREISDEKRKGYERTLKSLNIHNIEIVQFKDFVETNQFQNILTQVDLYLEKDLLFKQDLLNMMEIGIGGKIVEFILDKNLTAEQQSEYKKTLSRYIIEEFCALIYFTEMGYNIELDPHTEFTTKKLLYEGAFPELAESLQIQKRGHIFIYPPETSYYSN